MMNCLRIALLALAVLLPAAAAAADLHHTTLATRDYALARQLLVDSIEDEGLIVASVSNFGEMLRRTDKDLKHGGARYAHAEVLAFCSARVAATLVQEDLSKIAFCPLTVGIYQGLGAAAAVEVAYRLPAGESPGAQAAADLLERITRRMTEFLPAR
jgi:uncharacterized protein (DUF302 family)